ncbi:MAG: ABC-type uncharacterized transport system permease subunit [Lysobacterales bacterium]
MLISTAVAYFSAVLFLYYSILRSSNGLRTLAKLSTSAGLMLHGVAQYQQWLAVEVTGINILNILSLCALVVVALLVTSLFLKKPIFDAGLIALPIAVLAVGAEWLLDIPGTQIAEVSTEVSAHILSSILAFGVLSVAGVYALFVALIDHFLRQHHLNRLIRTLPALEILERLLFQLIGIGFVLLTISLGTGLLFVSDMFAQHLAHKTILSIIAWLVFGTLLWGRRFRGWRGRVAVRMTLAGILLLLLSYFGSKLVLEVLLDRSWQT